MLAKKWPGPWRSWAGPNFHLRPVIFKNNFMDVKFSSRAVNRATWSDWASQQVSNRWLSPSLKRERGNLLFYLSAQSYFSLFNFEFVSQERKVPEEAEESRDLAETWTALDAYRSSTTCWSTYCSQTCWCVDYFSLTVETFCRSHQAIVLGVQSYRQCKSLQFPMKRSLCIKWNYKNKVQRLFTLKWQRNMNSYYTIINS